MKTVLTIAGFDPSSGAGVTADLKVFAAHGLFGTACITALTVQSTLGVLSSHPVSSEIVAETLTCLDSDLPPSGVKIGMVSNSESINRISSYLYNLRQKHSYNSGSYGLPIVLDPVLRSSSGRELLDPASMAVLHDRLLPQVTWITPNLDELAALTGQSVSHRDDIPAACHALQARVATIPGRPRLGIFATGGHLDPPDDFLLLPSGEDLWLHGERIQTESTHGTGCALSSAFLCRLVLGDTPQQAAVAAKLYVTEALKSASEIGTGHGPINHLWPLTSTK